MRRSEWEDRCNRHPDHRTSKGVCPYCLRDRLAHLSASASASAAPTTRRASSSSSSATTSACSSGGSSPPRHRAALSADVSSVHVVAGSSFADAAASFSQPLMPTSVSKKVPTTAAAAGRRDEAAQPARGEAEVRRKKIGRFLSRLIGAEKRRHTGDGGGELVHSKTMKEKTAFKWVFF
ncbi:hypothetical protein Zm00014a_017932 [Zea mays]|uniref:Uncharacterized protein n=2 Tax=Zea mays TaxID=4577 RepID=B6SZ10_MAIZE|nr:hypothetical protein [Zea mays]PWZ05260.1 hypothetical protein Zm00014a_017932 [Zea mays]